MVRLQFQNISKDFGLVRVLKDVSFNVLQGEVVALMGENGAGKSTLMKVLSGIYPRGEYFGSFTIEGNLCEFNDPRQAEKSGVGIIHQELSFFPSLTVGENLVVGAWPAASGFIDWSETYSFAEKWLARVGLEIDPKTAMSDLSVGQQQLVEIAKALSKDSRILVLDEPTSALTKVEVTRLFELILEVKREGRSLIYISHKMDEIFKIADRIVVLRDGAIVGDKNTTDWTEEALIKTMVGRDVTAKFPPKALTELGKKVLELKDVRVRTPKSSCLGQSVLGPLNFEVSAGQILGLAGLLGAGRTEILKGLFGCEGYSLEGESYLCGKKWAPKGPRQALSSGVAYLSEDRKRESVLGARSLLENFRISSNVLSNLAKKIDFETELNRAKTRFHELRVKFSDPQQDILELSGGNQQKVVLARCLDVKPHLVLLDEPTRGVDVGAKFEIYQLLFELAKKGVAVLLVSSELPELFALCDRIVVVSGQRVSGEFERSEFDAERVMERAFLRSERAQ